MKKAIFYTDPFEKGANLRYKKIRNHGKLQRVAIIATMIAVIATPFIYNPPVEANRLNELNAEIAAVNERLSGLRGEANRLANEARTLANEIGRLQAEMGATQATIDLKDAERRELETRIEMNEVRIQKNREALGVVIANMYLESRVGLLERIASSQNLSSFIDQETMASAASSALHDKVEEIQALQAQLDEQRIEVERIIEEQKAHKALLDQQRAEQAHILAVTQGEEANFQRMVGEANAHRESLMAEQRRIMEEILRGQNSISGSHGSLVFNNYSGEQACGTWGYPFCGFAYPTWRTGGSRALDPWALYQRECVSWAAWRIYHGHGRHVESFRGMGHARQWPHTATTFMGATANNTPAVGAAAVWQGAAWNGGFGHVAVVEAILDNGWVRVSQMNFAVSGNFSTMDIPANSVGYVHFRSR